MRHVIPTRHCTPNCSQHKECPCFGLACDMHNSCPRLANNKGGGFTHSCFERDCDMLLSWHSSVHLLMGIVLRVRYEMPCTFNKLLGVLILCQVCLSDPKRSLQLSFIRVGSLFWMNKQALSICGTMGELTRSPSNKQGGMASRTQQRRGRWGIPWQPLVLVVNKRSVVALKFLFFFLYYISGRLLSHDKMWTSLQFWVTIRMVFESKPKCVT